MRTCQRAQPKRSAHVPLQNNLIFENAADSHPLDAQHHSRGQAMLQNVQQGAQGAAQDTMLTIAESDLDAAMQLADPAGLSGAIRGLVVALGSAGNSHTAAVKQVSSAVSVAQDLSRRMAQDNGALWRKG